MNERPAKKRRNYFPSAKLKASIRPEKSPGIVSPAIDSTKAQSGESRIGDSVSRRRFQKGSVFQNKTKTMWLGSHCEYVLDKHGVEKRIRKQINLCPVKDGGRVIGKREAQRLLQPHLDRVNSAIASPATERKSATFEGFAAIWERDYLALSKPSTISACKSHLKLLKAQFGKQDMRSIDAGNIQRLITSLLNPNGPSVKPWKPKTVRNLWGTISLIWKAALAQKYVDAELPKPKLPKKPKVKPRFFKLSDVANIIAMSQGEHRVFYWLAAETGLRAGELAGLKLTDIDGEKLTVNQSVWNGDEQSPKTDNALRTLGMSPQLITLLWEQIARQKAKGHEYLFSSSTGTPWDMNVYRKRKMRPMLTSLGIPHSGFHAFRHFNVSLLDSLRVPLKTIQERIGHAFTGSFTLDVYGGEPEWKPNLDAARLAGAEIEKAVAVAKTRSEQANTENVETAIPFGSLTAISSPDSSPENQTA
jgi:integrase